MAKRKAEDLSQIPLKNGIKKVKHGEISNTAKPNLLDDSSSEDESSGGADLKESGFKINEDFANRFEHSKKREELHRCQFIAPSFLGLGS